jgi:hypothetical protein
MALRRYVEAYEAFSMLLVESTEAPYVDTRCG